MAASRVPERDRGGGGRRWLAILVAVAFLFILVSGVGAYVVLPTAIVTVRAVPERVGPLSLEITADPLAANVDPVKLVVPADIVTFDLEATDEFPATGIKITEANGRRHPALDELRPDQRLHDPCRDPRPHLGRRSPSRPPRPCSCRSRR